MFRCRLFSEKYYNKNTSIRNVHITAVMDLFYFFIPSAECSDVYSQTDKDQCKEIQIDEEKAALYKTKSFYA